MAGGGVTGVNGTPCSATITVGSSSAINARRISLSKTSVKAATALHQPPTPAAESLRSALHMGDTAKGASDSGKGERKAHVPWTEDELAALHDGVAK